MPETGKMPRALSQALRAGVGLCAAALWLMLAMATPLRAEPVEVVASIPPVQFLIDRIGAGHVTSILLMPQGKDPHTFEPLPRQLVAVARARACFTVGLPFEERVVGKIRAGNPRLAVIRTDEGVAKLPYGEEHAGADDDHGHHEGADDPHIWLSPRILAKMAANVQAGLAAILPAAAGDFQKNQARLAAELATVDQELSLTLTPFRGRVFYVYHPGFGYFADAYGLKQRAVEEAGKTPSPQSLSILIREALTNRVRVIFVQPQFDRKSAEAAAAAINGSVVSVDTLSYDALANLREIAGKFVEALR